MKYLFFLTAILCALDSNSQTIGSTWHYSAYRGNNFISYAVISLTVWKLLMGKMRLN